MLVELIGPTGAGKSTLATLLRGHLGGPATATTATMTVSGLRIAKTIGFMLGETPSARRGRRRSRAGTPTL